MVHRHLRLLDSVDSRHAEELIKTLSKFVDEKLCTVLICYGRDIIH